jgi:hypothetical protein
MFSGLGFSGLVFCAAGDVVSVGSKTSRRDV